MNVLEGIQVVNFEVLPSETNSSSISSLLSSPALHRHGRMRSGATRDLLETIGNLHYKQTTCLLMFEVVNTTSHMFWITYHVGNKEGVTTDKQPVTVVTMAPHSGRRLMMPFKRFDVPKEEILKVTLQSELRQFVRSDSNLTPEEENLVRYYYLIKQELIKRVKITWKSVSSL